MLNRAFYLSESAPVKDEIPPARQNVKKLMIHARAIMVHKIIGECAQKVLKECYRGELRSQNTNLKRSSNTYTTMRNIKEELTYVNQEFNVDDPSTFHMCSLDL